MSAIQIRFGNACDGIRRSVEPACNDVWNWSLGNQSGHFATSGEVGPATESRLSQIQIPAAKADSLCSHVLLD
jgi:hypothetical protein